jgi:Cdc6-like AAA superfamily ATPase
MIWKRKSRLDNDGLDIQIGSGPSGMAGAGQNGPAAPGFAPGTDDGLLAARVGFASGSGVEMRLDETETRVIGPDQSDMWRSPVEPASMLPRFLSSASDDIEAAHASELARRRLALRDALGSSTPVISREAFAGRHDAMAQLITAIEEQRVHVVIYGERGIGKTSLVHVFADTAREARYHVIYASCGTAANFAEMFRSICARIPRIYHASVMPNSAEAERGDSFDVMLPDGAFGARELAEVLAGVVGTRVLIILDEYDRVADPEFRRDIAETIKNLSDRAARVQLVITGVGLNLDELIGYAPSIRRNIAGLPMRPLNANEVRDLLRMGEDAASIRFGDDAVAMIASMADGSPYLVRLISHQAGMIALNDQRSLVTENDTRSAINHVLEDWQASLPRRVQASLARDEARANWEVLVAAARAGSGADGWFTVDDVHVIMGGRLAPLAVERDLKMFTNTLDLLERREGAGEPHYRFSYPGVTALLIMSAAIARMQGGPSMTGGAAA